MVGPRDGAFKPANDHGAFKPANDQPLHGAFGRDYVITSKCEISTREAAQVGTTTLAEVKAVETRKGVGRETDTPREIET